MNTKAESKERLWKQFKPQPTLLSGLLLLLWIVTVAVATEPFQILHTFTGQASDWYHPGPLTLSGATLYGPGLPSSSGGILYKINTDGSNYTLLKTFAGPPNDGSYPGAVIASGTTLYGTTRGGGSYYYGAGTVFRINTDGSGYTILHQFDGTNGANPSGVLAVSGTTLYGATADGGSNDVWGRGTVFAINTDGSDFRVLKGFCGVNCTGLPARPEAGVVLSDGILYGTTTYDYANTVDVQCGSIFKINTDGSGYTVLFHLTGAEGRQPQTPLIISGTTIYGSAPGGGVADKGTIFKLNTDGTGFTVLKHFMGEPNDGDGPGRLMLSGTRLYGATVRGGVANFGTLFMLNTDGSGYTVLKHSTALPPNGIYPGISVFSDMTLYGTTYSAGPGDYGEIFGLTLSFPQISTTPRNQTAEIGATVAFTGDMTGFPPPNLNWFFNNINVLAGCTNSILQLTNVQPSHIGVYTAVVTNAFGAVTSSPAALNVILPVERRIIPGINLKGEVGSVQHLDYTDALTPAPKWANLTTVSLTDTEQFSFDGSSPLPPQRYYRAWQSSPANVVTILDLHMVSAITLTGTIGSKLQVDGINTIGPTDAWFTVGTVTLTNLSQLYFDVSALEQPQRLYRLVPVP